MKKYLYLVSVIILLPSSSVSAWWWNKPEEAKTSDDFAKSADQFLNGTMHLMSQEFEQTMKKLKNEINKHLVYKVTSKYDDIANTYIVQAELKGFNEKDIKVAVKSQKDPVSKQLSKTLLINAQQNAQENSSNGVKAEAKQFNYSTSIPEDVIADKVSAKFEKEILTISFPSNRAKNITIKEVKILSEQPQK